MTFGAAIRECYQKYLVFNGRAARPEYWWFVLFAFLVSIALSIFTTPLLVSSVSGDGSFSGAGAGVLGLLYVAEFVGVGLPGLAVTVRRLHDTGRSGWYWFIVLIPLVGPIILIVFLASQGDPAANTYGNPSTSS